MGANDTDLVEEPGRGKKPGSWIRMAVFLVLVGGLIAASMVFDLGDEFKRLRDWIGGLGPWGPAAFIAIYIVAAVAFLPGSVLTASAGAIFGSFYGILYTIIGATLGASLAFLTGRYLARDTVAGWVSKNEKFKKLDQLTEKNGAIIVAVTRLVPIFPFNLLNYGFGLTRVRFWTYVFWSFLCMVPGTALYVVGADAIFKGIAQGRVPWALVGVLVALSFALTLIVRRARKWLREREEECEDECMADRVRSEGGP